MFYLHRIQRGIDFIEAHLDTDIALSEVAQAAGLSQWHFQRIFKALTNETLKTYIRARRFAKALDQLLTTRLGILDIALAAGYDTQESFTRAFKTCFALTPNQYRKFGKRSLFVKKIQFDEDYLRQLHRNVSLTPDIRLRPPMQMVGVETHFFGSDSDKDNLAAKLPPLWASFIPRLGEVAHTVSGVCYGVVSQTTSTSDLLQYHAAIEVSEAGPLPHGMVGFELPAAHYATFEHRGPVDAVNSTVNYIYASWLARAEQRHSGGADLEIYGSAYNPASDTSVMHYAVPLCASIR
ncbi:MAG: helix-turn-helix domain-containing protein [Rhodoferax sp.]|nr:helix-turn-helix domain-containing protein [Rhodoferax sp.]